MKEFKLSLDLGPAGTVLVFRSRRGEFEVLEMEPGGGFALPAWPGTECPEVYRVHFMAQLLQCVRSVRGLEMARAVELFMTLPEECPPVWRELWAETAEVVFEAPVRVIPEGPAPLSGWRARCLQDYRVALARGKSLILSPSYGEYVLRGTQLLPVLPAADAAVAELAAAGVHEADFQSALVQAVQQRDAQMVQLLLAAGVDAGVSAGNGGSVLHLAVENRAPECLRALLAADAADVNARDAEGHTPLMLAAMMQERECERLLLNCISVDVGCTNKAGRSLSAVTKNLEQLLLAPWLELNASLTGSGTLLHDAVQHSMVRAAEVLMRVPGIDVNMRDAGGWTPLHCAAVSPYSMIVLSLLNVPGIDVALETPSGKTAADMAEADDRHYIAELLRAAEQGKGV